MSRRRRSADRRRGHDDRVVHPSFACVVQTVWVKNGFSRADSSTVVRVVTVCAAAVLAATALTSCRTGAATAPTPASSWSASDAPSPAFSSSAETPAPAESSSPSVSPVPSTPPATATVTIITLEVLDGSVQASGIVPGIVESDGKCSLTITRGDQTRTASAAASAGRESTYCGLVSVPVGGADTGNWDAVLTYQSPATTARSETNQVSVP